MNTRLRCQVPHVAVVAFLLAAFAAARAQGSLVVPAFTASQLATLERGDPVQILQQVETSPWPRSVVYQFIAATPEEAAAVLSDYELQSTYIPRLKVSRIVARHGANETDVEYVLDVPFYADERSVSRQRVSLVNSEYQVHWRTVVDSQHPGSTTTGRATFVAMTNATTRFRGTLMVHDQLVIPNSVFARVPYVRNKGIEASRITGKAIARQIERERVANGGVLARQVARLRAALASTEDSGKVTKTSEPE